MELGKLAIFITIFSGLIYQVCLKFMSNTANPIVSLIFTYISSLLGLIILLFFYRNTGKISIMESFNFTSIILGLAIVGIEIGVILSYKSGWNLSFTPILVTIGISLFLIPIGVYIFNESFSLIKLLGIFICLTGIFILKFF